MKNKYQLLVNKTIPISKKLGWKIQQITPKMIITTTNLEPNINIHGTAFAGSIYAAGMATGWTLLKCWYDQQNYNADLVAAEANIKYIKPVYQDFLCRSQLEEKSPNHTKLITRLSQNKSCGVEQKVEIECDSSICAILNIQFVFKCT
ncbi:YiiD C-terminal domain-containing protein [Aliikangiella sp. IMCC44359]|uniref:YiiD C-terminal domain-containing protein n=1 Tax=Aliikangiella sp. IMCC44359 TaxID=3459125 RepID=UPI00403A8174